MLPATPSGDVRQEVSRPEPLPEPPPRHPVHQAIADFEPPPYEKIEDNPFWEGHNERRAAAKWPFFTVWLAGYVDGEIVVKCYSNLDEIQDVSELIIPKFTDGNRFRRIHNRIGDDVPAELIVATFQDGMGTSFYWYIHPYTHPETGEEVSIRHDGHFHYGISMMDILYTDIEVYREILNLLKE
jgi:hypothetical protein